MELGNLKVLISAELVIIGGAAIGTVLIANPLFNWEKIVGVFGDSKFGKSQYMEIMKMPFELFTGAEGRIDHKLLFISGLGKQSQCNYTNLAGLLTSVEISRYYRKPF
jgi:hypothetical protein